MYIRAGRFTLDGSNICSNTYGTRDSHGGIDIDVDAFALHPYSDIAAVSYGLGSGGELRASHMGGECQEVPHMWILHSRVPDLRLLRCA